MTVRWRTANKSYNIRSWTSEWLLFNALLNDCC